MLISEVDDATRHLSCQLKWDHDGQSASVDTRHDSACVDLTCLRCPRCGYLRLGAYMYVVDVMMALRIIMITLCEFELAYTYGSTTCIILLCIILYM